jgi:radical SAM protein with 4Fe4S-binding SPASM domain
MAVLWNGDVTVCCGDIDGELSVGNVRDSTIEEIWNGAEIKKIRKAHFSKDFSSLPLCDRCDGTNKTKLRAMREAESVYR